MGGHEIVSLHLGNYANYVAAHFWNLQDEVLGHADGTMWGHVTPCIDQSPLFAEGLDSRGHVTWRPRALFADLSGALGGVQPVRGGQSALPSVTETVSTWSGGLDVHAAPRVPKSDWVVQLEQQQQQQGADDGDAGDEEEQDAQQEALEHAAAALSAGQADQHTGSVDGAGVRFWTDYLKVVLPPKSVLTLPGAWHGVTDFSGYGDSLTAVPGGSEGREAFSERIRGMVEECDSLQGFQVFAEDMSGWGGLTRHVLEEIHHEYCSGGRPCVVFSVRPPPSASEQAYHTIRRSLNEALVLSSIHECADLYVPVALPAHPPKGRTGLSHLRWAPTSHFATSAVLAAAIDTALLPQRLTGTPTPLGICTGAVNMHSLANLLTGCQRGCPLVGLAVALPLPMLAPPTHQALANADSRTHAAGNGNGSAATGDVVANGSQLHGPPAPDEQLSQLSYATCITPGLRDAQEDTLAQSLCMRGARTTAGPASCSVMQETLDALVRSSGHRCVTHRSVTPLPLLVPLPFPRNLWDSTVGPNGRIALAEGRAGPNQAEQLGNGSLQQGMPSSSSEVSSAPMMTKLFATSQFEGYLTQVAGEWQRASASTSGRAMLDQWDIDRSGLETVTEAVHELATLYRDDEDAL